MKAIFKTKNNYGNLNGKQLDVIEISGNRISCLVFSEEFNRDITIDFSLPELDRFTDTTNFPVIMGLISNRHTMKDNSTFQVYTLFENGNYYIVFKDKREGFDVCRIKCTGENIRPLRNFQLIDNI